MSQPRQHRLDAVLGVEITGVDLSQPIADPDFDEIADAFNQYSVLLIREQQLDAPALASFARRFGPLQISANQRYCCPDEPEIMMVGNLSVDGELKSMFVNAREDWHIDQIQTASPNIATLLYAVETPPEGADTLFVGMHAAYDALDEATKARIDPLDCVYSIKYLDAGLRAQDPTRPPLSAETIAEFPPASHPLARIHPVTQRKSLCIAPDIMSHIEGMTRKESLALVKPLADHAMRSEFLYRHRWQNGDFLMWDNRCTMHTATVFDSERYQRLLYRAIIAAA
jgi:taurine dioxygenase